MLFQYIVLGFCFDFLADAVTTPNTLTVKGSFVVVLSHILVYLLVRVSEGTRIQLEANYSELFDLSVI